MSEMDGGPLCPWSWHGLPCALSRAHPSPHQIVGEQPQFAAIDHAARADAEWHGRELLHASWEVLRDMLNVAEGMDWPAVNLWRRAKRVRDELAKVVGEDGKAPDNNS